MASNDPALYPPIEPYRHGWLDVGDGNLVYWEECGNPRGKPALFLHGGPGSGSNAGMRRYFDPAAYRVVLFDQRNCGRSTPHASDPATDLTSNTTGNLLADIEQLREHLGIERWLVFGGSWGSVLGLVYAERFPQRVSEMVLMALATGRRVETDLLTRGLGALFPEAWERFCDMLPEAQRDGDLADAYHRLLSDPDPAVRDRAARRWCEWEDAIVPTAPGPNPRFDDPAFRMAFARLVTHYWRHGSWLEEGEVLQNAGRLEGIPGILVQGSLDLGNLVGTPWELAHAWPGSELVLIDEAGHGASDPGMAEALVGATDRLAARA
ncbi:prolyl aminopeptidase [Actinobacteria bacterium YIM 96077]|uniref:Proline iminopeptidase n=1 Tax=Phytoactinopolyspora halophila TaxID=1981511 RepID=A0A329QUW6_9ACTN|nr:prolyl aminopeptidase [Phytoactinopolyspora halophila]AYY14932.1 prolyl aminopeptidase [Actinobacteria bacterium YIM 96077]RAW15389.1 prolyl aminopeptidase [Phytoactinopolyspora halophila]